LPHKAFTPAKRTESGLESFALLRTLLAFASAKFPYALQPHKATIVLSVFTRSFPADEPHLNGGALLSALKKQTTCEK